MDYQNNRNEIIVMVKTLREDLWRYVDRIRFLEERIKMDKESGIAEAVLARRNLQQTRHWLGEALAELGHEHPYPNGNNPANTIVDPRADVPK